MAKEVVCPVCNQRLKLGGLSGHLRFKHPEEYEERGYETLKKEATEIKGEEGGKGEDLEGTKEERYTISTSKSSRLTGKDLDLAERLIDEGLAENLSDLMRKALRLYGGIHFRDVLLKGGKWTRKC